MKDRRGIAAVVTMAALCGSAPVCAWAQTGVTEKVGQTRVTTVPAPLPQALPAGQGMRPSAVPRPSVAQPAAPEAVVIPKPPEVPSRAALPSTSLTRPDVEVAPVAPSLAAHGLSPAAVAPPAAGLTGEPVKAPVKPAARAPAASNGHPATARTPADAEPTLRPEPPSMATARAKHHKPAGVHGQARAPVAHRKGDVTKPVSTSPMKAHKSHKRLNDGSQP